jgi:hypothetical protein
MTLIRCETPRQQGTALPPPRMRSSRGPGSAALQCHVAFWLEVLRQDGRAPCTLGPPWHGRRELLYARVRRMLCQPSAEDRVGHGRLGLPGGLSYGCRPVDRRRVRSKIDGNEPNVYRPGHSPGRQRLRIARQHFDSAKLTARACQTARIPSQRADQRATRPRDEARDGWMNTGRQ